MSAEEKTNDKSVPVEIFVPNPVKDGFLNDEVDGSSIKNEVSPDNIECKCCKCIKNECSQKKKQSKVLPYAGVAVTLTYLALVSFAVPAVWTNPKVASWYLTFIGLGTLFLSLCAYAYDNLISHKEPGPIVRVLKVLGDVGAGIVVLGTVNPMVHQYIAWEVRVAGVFVVVILALTAYKTYNDI